MILAVRNSFVVVLGPESRSAFASGFFTRAALIGHRIIHGEASKMNSESLKPEAVRSIPVNPYASGYMRR
jgi:hypothetical protein